MNIFTKDNFKGVFIASHMLFWKLHWNFVKNTKTHMHTYHLVVQTHTVLIESNQPTKHSSEFSGYKILHFIFPNSLITLIYIICVYIHTCMYSYIHIHTYICTYTCMHIYMYMYESICIYTKYCILKAITDGNWFSWHFIWNSKIILFYRKHPLFKSNSFSHFKKSRQSSVFCCCMQSNGMLELANWLFRDKKDPENRCLCKCGFLACRIVFNV